MKKTARLCTEELSRPAESIKLSMAVVGGAGGGKSTLINSLLCIDPSSQDAADESASIGTSDVHCYTRSRDHVKINIWDTPGPGNLTYKEMLKRLHNEAGDNIDLLVFCIACFPGVRVNDSHINIIKLLTKLFGKEAWKRSLLVLTMVNTIQNKKSIAQNIEKGLKGALRSAGVPEGVVSDQRLLLAGLREEPLPINENETIDWNYEFFLHCFHRLGIFSVTYMHVQYTSLSPALCLILSYPSSSRPRERELRWKAQQVTPVPSWYERLLSFLL